MKLLLPLLLSVSIMCTLCTTAPAQPTLPALRKSATADPSTSAVESVLIQLPHDDLLTTSVFAKAYSITSSTQLTAGNLADAYLGDLVLENEQMRVVIARPGKVDVGVVRAGTVMDVVRTGAPVDYLGGLNTTVNPGTTASQVIYDKVNVVGVFGNSTATLTLAGYVGGQDAPPPPPVQRLNVSTRFNLEKGSPVLQINTTFTNQTTRTAWLHPADIIDWGEAEVFSEGGGYGATTAPVNFVIGAKDNFALGYYTSGTQRMEGTHQGRESVILASGAMADLARQNMSRKLAELESEKSLAPEYRGYGATPTKGPGMVMLPGTETRYTLGTGSMPVAAPLYVNESQVTYLDGKATITLSAARQTVFERPQENEISSSVQLEPGQSYNFTRYLAASDANWKPITENAYTTKNVKLARLSGVVVEGATGKPIGGAVVRVSGGAGYDGTGSAAPALQLKTREDGSFTVRMPSGRYRLDAMALGRRSIGQPRPIDVRGNTQPQVAVLQMSKESLLRIAISEAETVTSSPLPVKVTLVSKPPYPTENYGFTPDVSRGVRNTYYLPQGAAVFPVTPGRYRLVISRGIEYDILEKDINVSAGREQTVTGSLPHVMKGLLPGMVSMDAGVVSNASAVGFASPESRAIQAACEGVSIIVSGDYGQATDLQAAIKSQGLERWVKAFVGRRDLLGQGGLSADLFVYPLDEVTSTTYAAALATVSDLPPDVALADLKKQFPNLLFEISRPMHPEAGYLTSFPFDISKRQFTDNHMPPPDFDAVQVLEGKKLGLEEDVYARYMAMQLQRLGQGEGSQAPPLTPVGSSFSRLPYGQEIGYPRTYLYLNRDKPLAQVDVNDVVSAVRGQHLLVTNGPILLFDALNFSNLEFDVKPGDILDAQTTEVVRIRARVLAAPWITLQGINTRENGARGISVFNIKPSENVKRYPTNQSGSEVYTRYLDEDTVLDAFAFSSLRSLAPVVPNALTDFGGALYPYCMSGPIFVDRNGDGKITINKKEP